MSSEQFEHALQLLWDFHGYPKSHGDDDILGVLIQTILSQSTNNENSTRAFESLLETFDGDWSAVERAPVARVAESIAIGGLSNQKAPRIQAILARAHEESPDAQYSLEYLRQFSGQQARAYLESFPGVGPKTARFTLMYAAGADLFPMDTHIFRILDRVGILDSRTSDRKAHEAAEAMLPPGQAYPAHMVLVTHGRQVCHARGPECDRCPLEAICPSATTRPD